MWVLQPGDPLGVDGGEGGAGDAEGGLGGHVDHVALEELLQVGKDLHGGA